jgi:nucleoside-diphosphate-sugar epimerase
MEAPPVGAEIVAADALEPAATAPLLAGATTVYQCAQPAYHRWAEEFPALQEAIVEAARSAGAKLVVAENLYVYGKPEGKALVETLPYRPCSKKGRVRSAMTEALFAAHQAGRVRASSVRGSDFFGPWEPITSGMVFKAALAGKPASLMGRLDVPHSFTYVKDFGRALAIAGTDDRALGRAWHVPSGPAMTQRELCDLLAAELGHPVKAQAAGRVLLSIVGLFNPGAREMVEMLYEFTEPFVIDGSDLERTFGLQATPMRTRLQETLEWLRTR